MFGGNAKIANMSHTLINSVSNVPGKVSTSLMEQVTNVSSQPFADIGKKIAVSHYHFACLTYEILIYYHYQYYYYFLVPASTKPAG